MKRKPKGIGILELSVAGIVVALLAATIVQLVVAVAGQHRALAKRQVAMQESANVMEHLFTRTWEELNPESVAGVTVSDEARKSIRGANLTIEIRQPQGEAGVKQIAVLIRWPDRKDRPDQTVRLVAWRYHR